MIRFNRIFNQTFSLIWWRTRQASYWNRLDCRACFLLDGDWNIFFGSLSPFEQAHSSSSPCCCILHQSNGAMHNLRQPPQKEKKAGELNHLLPFSSTEWLRLFSLSLSLSLSPYFFAIAQQWTQHFVQSKNQKIKIETIQTVWKFGSAFFAHLLEEMSFQGQLNSWQQVNNLIHTQKPRKTNSFELNGAGCMQTLCDLCVCVWLSTRVIRFGFWQFNLTKVPIDQTEVYFSGCFRTLSVFVYFWRNGKVDHLCPEWREKWDSFFNRLFGHLMTQFDFVSTVGRSIREKLQLSRCSIVRF